MSRWAGHAEDSWELKKESGGLSTDAINCRAHRTLDLSGHMAVGGQGYSLDQLLEDTEGSFL